MTLTLANSHARYSFDKVNRFVDEMMSEATRNFYRATWLKTPVSEQYHQKLCDPDARFILYVVLNEAARNPDGFFSSKAMYTIGNPFCINRKRVYNRLTYMAQFGIVSAISAWRNDGTKKRESIRIYPNPVFESEEFMGRYGGKLRKEFCGWALAVGHRRETELREGKEIIQGFHSDILWGFEESEVNKISDVEGKEAVSRLQAKINDQDIAKDEKRRHRAKWRALCDGMISAMAKVWVTCNLQRGNGPGLPDWALDNPSPSQKRQRRELEQIFKNNGGSVTALAWHTWLISESHKDETTGKMIFDMSIPHRQFRPPDYRPDAFGKYINSIKEDIYFVAASRENWTATKRHLEGYYGDLLDEMPESGAHYSEIIGYTFGDLQPPTRR